MSSGQKVFAASPMRVKWLAFAKNIKPWSMFFLAKNNYVLPAEKVPIERIKKNIDNFYANYLIFLTPLILLALLGDLLLLLLLGASYAGWFYVESNRRPEFIFDDKGVSSEAKIGLLVIGNLFLIVLLTGAYIFTIIGLCVTFIVIHASFIDENQLFLAKNPNEKNEENSEIHPEERAMFDTQIINKESYGLTINEDPALLI